MSRKLGRGLDVLIGKPEPAADQLSRRAEVLPAAELQPERAPAVEAPGDPAPGDPAPVLVVEEVAPAEGDELRRVLEIPPEQIDPNPAQPRREFAPAELENLRASIAREGVLQPIVVREAGERYQVVAGERRLRACQELGLEGVERAVDPLTQLAVALCVHWGGLRREQPVERGPGGGGGRVVCRLVNSELLLQLVCGLHVPTSVQVLKNECVQ